MVHCRDNFGVEVDAIVKLRDGRWGACVISLGEGHVEAAASLLLFQGQLNLERTGAPAFLALLCGKGLWLSAAGWLRRVAPNPVRSDDRSAERQGPWEPASG